MRVTSGAIDPNKLSYGKPRPTPFAAQFGLLWLIKAWHEGTGVRPSKRRLRRQLARIRARKSN